MALESFLVSHLDDGADGLGRVLVAATVLVVLGDDVDDGLLLAARPPPAAAAAAAANAGRGRRVRTVARVQQAHDAGEKAFVLKIFC